MKTHRIIPSAKVCSRMFEITIDHSGIITSIRIEGGCHGNGQGLCALITGMHTEQVISRLKGIECNGKGTSCPDQLAIGLENIGVSNR